MNFSLGKPTTIRMTNCLIIKVFNLQQNDCKYKTESDDVETLFVS